MGCMRRTLRSVTHWAARARACGCVEAGEAFLRLRIEAGARRPGVVRQKDHRDALGGALLGDHADERGAAAGGLGPVVGAVGPEACRATGERTADGEAKGGLIQAVVSVA